MSLQVASYRSLSPLPLLDFDIGCATKRLNFLTETSYLIPLAEQWKCKWPAFAGPATHSGLL